MTTKGRRFRQTDRLARRRALGESCKEQPLPRTAAVHTAVARTRKESHIWRWPVGGRGEISPSQQTSVD